MQKRASLSFIHLFISASFRFYYLIPVHRAAICLLSKQGRTSFPCTARLAICLGKKVARPPRIRLFHLLHLTTSRNRTLSGETHTPRQPPRLSICLGESVVQRTTNPRSLDQSERSANHVRGRYCDVAWKLPNSCWLNVDGET